LNSVCWTDLVGAVGAVGTVGVGKEGAVGAGTGLGTVEAVGTAGAMASFRVAAIFALQPVLSCCCVRPYLVVGGVGTVATVGAVGVGGKGGMPWWVLAWQCAQLERWHL
jgi:hypothetical protein